jgi:MFS family permease
MSPTRPRHTFYYGWWVVIACSIIQFYLGGVFLQGFSALFNPIVEEFGWTYAIVSLAFTFRGFEAGILAPVVGIMVDKFGLRKLMVCGVIVSGTGFWFFSQVQALWSFYSAFLFLALGLSLGTGVVTMTAVARWFSIRGGLAQGILACGFGASGLLMPLVVMMVDNFGWRESSIIFAGVTGVLCLPLAFVVKDPPNFKSPIHQIPLPSYAKQVSNDKTPSKIFKSKNFWLLSMAILFGGVAGTAVIIHQIPYLVSVGITRQTAGILVIILAVSNVIGRLLIGYLGDKLEKRYCFAISVGIHSVGILFFALAHTAGQFIPSLLAMGIGYGGLIPLRPAIQSEFFGIRSFATIQGFLMISVTIGTILAPLFAGWMFDIMGTYRTALLILSAITLFAIPLVLAAHKDI